MMRVKTIRLSPPYRFADAMLVMGAMRMRAETMTAVGGFLPEAEPDGGKADAGGQQGNGEADQKEIAQIISRKGSGKSVEQVR